MLVTYCIINSEKDGCLFVFGQCAQCPIINLEGIRRGAITLIINSSIFDRSGTPWRQLFPGPVVSHRVFSTFTVQHLCLPEPSSMLSLQQDLRYQQSFGHPPNFQVSSLVPDLDFLVNTGVCAPPVPEYLKKTNTYFPYLPPSSFKSIPYLFNTKREERISKGNWLFWGIWLHGHTFQYSTLSPWILIRFISGINASSMRKNVVSRINKLFMEVGVWYFCRSSLFKLIWGTPTAFTSSIKYFAAKACYECFIPSHSLTICIHSYQCLCYRCYSFAPDL